MAVIIGRHINGITLNALEYLVDGHGFTIKFKNEQIARDYLLSHGLTKEDIYWFVFVEVEQ